VGSGKPTSPEKLVADSRYDIHRLREIGETPGAKQAFLDYLAMGTKRSMKKLHKQYRDSDLYVQDMRKDGSPPTRQIKQLKAWSVAHRWQKKLNQVQDEQIEVILKEQRRSLAELAREGFANPVERIRALNELAEALLERLRDENLLTTVIKQVGSGKSTKQVEEAKIDTPAIQQFRGILEDLAKETGGRVRIGKIAHEYPDGTPTQNQIFVLPTIQEQLEPEPVEIVTVPATPLIGDNGNPDDGSTAKND
jgi:hypothetical protein